MTGAAAKQTVVDLKKKTLCWKKKSRAEKKIPSVHEKMEAAAQRSRLESQIGSYGVKTRN